MFWISICILNQENDKLETSNALTIVYHTESALNVKISLHIYKYGPNSEMETFDLYTKQFNPTSI